MGSQEQPVIEINTQHLNIQIEMDEPLTAEQTEHLKSNILSQGPIFGGDD